MKIHISLFLLLCCFGGAAFATSWYVDNAASGSNNGTSWTNAWNSFASVVWGPSGVKAGDTLYISGSSTSQTYVATGNYMLTVGASGTAGNPITLATGAKSPSPSGHDGKVIFEGSGTYFGLIFANGNSYIVIDGEKSGASNWTFQNSTTANEAAAVVVQGVNFSKVSYLTIAHIGMGIWATYSNSLEISYCSITDVQNDVAIRSIMSNSGATQYGLSKFHHNIIQTNVMASNGLGPDGFQSGVSTDIYNNDFRTAAGGGVVGSQHPDFVQSAGPYERIFNNVFRNPSNSAVDVDIQGNWGGTFNHFWVYNNVFCTDSTAVTPAPNWPPGIEIYNDNGSSITDVVIANNTFVDMAGDGISGGYTISISLNGTETVTNSLIQNNLFYNVSRTNYTVISGNNITTPSQWNIDYNLVNAGTHGITTLWINGASFSQAHPRTAAPTFVSYTVRSPSNDFHLSSTDMAAKGAGVNLGAYFTTDKDGVARGAAWDIGAYESSGAGSVTFNAPTGLRLKY